MVFDFAAQPPELISAKIYSGPGAESLTDCRGSLGRPGRRVAVNRDTVPVDDREPGRWRLDRSVSGGCRSRRRAVRVVVGDDRRTG